MPVQYMPGPEALLAPAAAQISTALTQFLDPNREFRETMRTVVAQSPELLQSLADLEAGSPGTLRAMGFESLGEVIAAVPESTASAADRASRGTVVGSANTRAQNAVRRDIADTTIAEANADVAEAEAPVRVAAAEDARARDTRHREWLQDTENLDFIDLAKESLAGRPPANLQQIMANEDTRVAYTTAMDILFRNRDDANARRIAAERDGNYIDTAASRAYFSTGMAGTIDTWAQYMTNQETRDEAVELAARPRSELTASERYIVDVHNAYRRMNAERLAEMSNEYRRGISSAVSQIRTLENQGADEASINIQVQNIQQLIDSNAAVTGREYTVHYGPQHRLLLPDEDKPEGIYFTPTDSEDIVPIEQVLAPLTPDPDHQLSSFAFRAYSDIVNLQGADREAALEALRNRNTEVYNEVIGALEADEE